jgi:hypothetical protein
MQLTRCYQRPLISKLLQLVTPIRTFKYLNNTSGLTEEHLNI